MKTSSSNRARERRLRAAYRKKIFIAVVVSLIVGAVAGFCGCKYLDGSLSLSGGNGSLRNNVPNSFQSDPTPTPVVTTEPTPEVTPTAVPTPTPTPVVTPTPTPVPTPEPTPIIVPYGESYTFDAQVYSADGFSRSVVDDQDYETLSFTLNAKRYLASDYYAANYSSQYRLSGYEAGVEFELTLNDYTGSAVIYPQKALSVTLQNADGEIERGFQLTNREIGGEYDVRIQTNVPQMFYKRFTYNEELGHMKYLVVTVYIDGVAQDILFELDEPEIPQPTATATPVYETLEQGSANTDAVAELQFRLIELGYLQGSADGIFGNMTVEAIKAAQADFGMEQTGIADNAFQQKLFSSQQ